MNKNREAELLELMRVDRPHMDLSAAREVAGELVQKQLVPKQSAPSQPCRRGQPTKADRFASSKSSKKQRKEEASNK
jgi:hypothetical protein